jgi:hypothetical protein
MDPKNTPAPELELTPAAVNAAKATPEQLRKVPLNSTNNESITKKIMSGEKRYKITIASTEKEKTPVFVGINGISYNIPRDVEVEVPHCVVMTLREAVTKSYTITESPGAEGAKINVASVPRFPVQSTPV